MKQETTFYEQLQASRELDLRDMRGKRLNLPLVLLGVILGLLRKRDGVLSSIHRSMMNNQERLCAALGLENEKVISRAHLPRILMKVKRSVFEKLIFDNYGIRLNEEQKGWFAGDGKELRGSIETGDKRGEASVQLVSHEDRAVLAQAYYSGTKESEKPCLRELVAKSGVKSQKLTVDALHLNPAMTELVASSGGEFIIGLKNNQKELLQDMIDHTKVFRPKQEHRSIDKGHGRLEIRQYACYDVSEEYFENRWSTSGFSSLLRVTRSRTCLKTNASSEEISYFISNAKAENALEYFQAIRNHWAIEVNNHYRDVSLKEDQLRTKKSRSLGYWQVLEPSSWNYCDFGNPKT